MNENSMSFQGSRESEKAIRHTDEFPEEIQIQEMHKEFEVLQDGYKKVIADMETSESSIKYMGEFCSMLEAIAKRQSFMDYLLVFIKEQHSKILELHHEVSNVMKMQQEDLDNIEKLKQEIANSLRVVDATHAREQVAQETIENLRQQITRLNAEMELKATLELDQDGDFTAIAKNKEAQIKEREKLEEELTVTKQKFEDATIIIENSNKQIAKLEIKVTDLTQELENKIGELAKEGQLSQKVNDDLVEVTAILDTKSNALQSTEIERDNLLRKLRKTENMLTYERQEGSRMKTQLDELGQRCIKFQEEFAAQAREFDIIGQNINLVGAQMKVKEKALIKSKDDYANLSKVIEASAKKILKLENKVKGSDNEKTSILIKLKSLEKDIKGHKNNMQEERKIVEKLNRDKETSKKAAEHQEIMIVELTKKLSFAEQVRRNQLMDLDMYEKTTSKLKSTIHNIDLEKDRYVEEAKQLTVKVEALMEDMKMKNVQVFGLKKKILESETQLKQQQNLFDIIRTERNTCAKELLEAQDVIDECKREMKIMSHQVEQLKEDISCKEHQLTSEEFAHRKLQSEIESLKVELQRWRDTYRENKHIIEAMRDEMNEVKRAIEVSEQKRYKMRKESDRIMNEKDILGSQLVRRNDEITLLYEKVTILQITLDRGKFHYNQRVDDIRLLKLEVEHLRKEKIKLTKIVSNVTDFRTEIYHLERDLTKERLKSRALEEELQTPLNIHRWRKLEGTDPDKMELIQKIQILQKRLLKELSASQNHEKKLKECNEKYVALKEELHRQPGPGVVEQLGKTQYALKQKTKNTKSLMGQVSAYKSEIADLNLSVQHFKNELSETKKLYLEQKSKAEKYRRQLEDLKKAKSRDDDEGDTTSVLLPPLPQKQSVGNVKNINGVSSNGLMTGSDSNLRSDVTNTLCNMIMQSL